MAHYHLAGRTIVITGSTGGLGSELAHALRARGAKLALFDVNEADVAAQADELGGSSVAFHSQVDVRDLDSLQEAMDRAAAHFGRIDVVVANAGVATVGTLATLDPAEFERLIEINLTGVWRTFRAGLTHVEKQRGYLLAISSMAAFVHSPLQAPYTASKAGVWALCDSIRLELRHLGVAVGSVHPTFFPTPMMDSVNDSDAATILWGGNKRGLWKMVPREQVVDGIVAGIERRAKAVVVPKSYSLVAKAPGISARSSTGSASPTALSPRRPPARCPTRSTWSASMMPDPR
jgi:NAD(P)-dependent dehydrogenase (short-subunit alcohol dehydrogenase family)